MSEKLTRFVRMVAIGDVIPRKIVVLIALLPGFCSLWAEDISISVDRVQQRYPWNGLVDIDYTVANVPTGREAEYYVQFDVIENGRSRTLHQMLDCSTLVDASNGTYRVTWDSAREASECHFLVKDATVKATIVFCGEDKFDCPYADQYLIVDLTGGASASSYPVAYRYLTFTRATNTFNTTEYKTNKLVLRRVKAGTFMMGSPSDEVGRETDAYRMNKETRHTVTLTQDYWLGVFEVTQAQYYRIMGSNPSYFFNSANSEYPVERVTYQTIRGSTTGCAVPPSFGNFDTGSFLEKISTRTGLTFDLPTEAQWEYACRAGTTTATYAAEGQTLDDLGWYGDDKGGGMAGGTTHPAGQKLPNGWGFYDILGNVCEICRDRATPVPNDNYGYVVSETNIPQQIDPVRDVTGGNCVNRGGHWYALPRLSRSASRGALGVTATDSAVGFRLSRTIP